MNILHFFYRVLRRISPNLLQKAINKLHGQKAAWKLTQKEATSCSFYPDAPKKPLSVIQEELRYLCSGGNGSWTNEATVSHYFQFGLDRQGSNIHDYIFQEKYDKAREAEQPAYAKMLQHKGYTATILKNAGINSTYSLGMIDSAGNILKNSRKVSTVRELLESTPGSSYFCKPIDGFQSKNCYRISYNNGFLLNKQHFCDEEAYKKLQNLSIEPYIEQHPSLNALYPDALNTVRVVTICREKNVTIYYSVIMIGSEGSHVSGIPLGGIVVNVDNSGMLCSLGHKSKKPHFGKLTHHPDTGMKLQGFQLPMWGEVIQLAKEAHMALQDIPSIGWDIAITPTGPIIIEANNGWGSVVPQYVSDSHKPLFDRYFAHLG